MVQTCLRGTDPAHPLICTRAKARRWEPTIERLDGKRIITGGTSGMGQAMVKGFSKLGANLVFFGRNTKAGAEIAEKTGARFMQVEISDEQQVNDAVRQSAELMGGIDVLIHAAAIDSHAPAEMITAEEWKKIFDVNAAETSSISPAQAPTSAD